MLGPTGTVGSLGAGPRPAGTSLHNSVTPSFSQSQASPVATFNRSVPLSSFDLPVAVSATHSSMPFSFVLVKQSRLPSGEKLMSPRLGLGGRTTLVSAPS